MRNEELSAADGRAMTETEVYAAALQRWGRWHQMVKCVEEMAELTQELCKRMDGAENNARLAEELADVEITLEQVKQFFRLDEEVRCWKGIKLKRLEEMLDAGD